MKRREKELERERERNLERERDTGRRGFMRVRRGGRVAGIADAVITDAGVAKMPQTRGSRPAFKSGREENADAVVGSASR